MNIQIFGRNKSFDTKKAERYFKERRIKYQYIDMDRYGISQGELKPVINSVGIEAVVNTEDQDYPLFKYLSDKNQQFEKLLDDQYLIKSPIVRNGKTATVGYCPDIWKTWE